MAEIDPVILRLIFERGTFIADINNHSRVVDARFNAMGNSAIALERKMKASLSSISAALKGAAGSFAAAFSAQQAAAFADGYTRIQNSLKVAGLEGRNLASVQAALLEQSTKYGVSLESLADLFGNASQAGKELGASQGDITRLTEATSQALLITGKNSQQAAGAILGLTQAFNKGKLQAEEWQQINEGGLRPLLQAAAASEKYGGSVAKLQAAAYDGKVSSKEFFDAILAGSAVLGGQASKATLTLSGAFEALNSRLTVYVGEADRAVGASARIAQGIGLLANNLDTVFTALSVVASFLAVRYVASVGAAIAANVAKSASDVRAAQTAAALLAMQARLAPVMLAQAASATAAARAVTGLSVATGVASRAGVALAAALGGPVGIALTAFSAALVYAALKTQETVRPTKQFADAQRQAAASADATAKAIDRLAFAHGKEREKMLESMRARREDIKLKLASAQASLAQARAELSQAQTSYKLAQDREKVAAKDPRLALGIDKAGAGSRLEQAAANADAQAKANESLARQLNEISSALNAPAYVPPPPAATDKKDKKTKASGKTAAELAAEQEQEMSRLRIEELQARLSLTTDTQKRADLQKEILAEEYKARLAEIAANKEISAEDKGKRRDALAKLYGTPPGGNDIVVTGGALLPKAVDQEAEDRKREADQRLLDLQIAAARSEADLIPGRQERLAAEERILDLVESQERSLLEADIATGQIADAEKARAALAKQQAARREGVSQQYEGPLASYARGLNKTPGQLKDQAEQLVVDELQSVQDGIRDALTKKLGIKDPFLAGLLDLFIQQVIMKPIANAFAGMSGGGGGGFLGSLIGGVGSILGFGGGGGGFFGGVTSQTMPPLSGRASGGYVAPGQLVRVNEGASPGRVEGFQPAGSGHIIPLGRMNVAGRGGGTTVIQQFTLDARYGITTPELLNAVNSRIKSEAGKAAGSAYAASQQSVPGTLNKYNQLNG